MDASGNEGSSGGRERRRVERVYSRNRASVLIAGQDIEGETVDISSSGVCLTLPTALRLGELYRVTIETQVEPSAKVTVIGRVCFCIEQPEGCRIGVHCANMDSLENAIHNPDKPAGP